ncbi:unnamed protein product [Brachionus calyciflorus]|uniref:Uncharacterized protein n=1 Tax=Brachionus calyciflorus TaxID=104777 RepID=A0A814P170_9BILA|nr:unnamed protein product [Brachionus calyciflorus]
MSIIEKKVLYIDSNFATNEYDNSPKTSSSNNRIPLASLISSDPNFYNNLNDSSFNYIESITDRSPLQKMREAKRQEEIQIQNRISERINAITKEDIDSEVKQEFS